MVYLGQTIMDINLKKLLTGENFSFQFTSSITLFVISFLFIFWIGSFFEVDIYPLENRSTTFTTFHVYIFEKYVDSIIITLLTTLWFCLSIRGKKRIISSISYGGLTAISLFTNSSPLLDTAVLISIPVITSFFVYHFLIKKIIQIQTNLLMSFFSLSVLCIAVCGLIISLISISSSHELPGWIRNHAVDISLLFSSFSPAFIFILLTGSLVKLLTFKGIRKIKIRIQQYQIKPQSLKQKNKFLFLSLFMFLSIFIALLPHQFFINSENEIVGADTVDYVKWLDSIQVNSKDNPDFGSFVVQNFGDRPLSLILFSPVLTIFPENPYQAIDNLPIILSPLLVLSVFFLSREITKNDTIALLASFLTAVSFQPLIGIYGGFYANWLALIFGYSSFVFLFRFLKIPNRINYLFFTILFFAMMLTHVHTWVFLSLFIGIFLVVSFRLKIFDKKRIAFIFLIIAASIAFDAGKSIMTDSPSGIERDVNITRNNASQLNLFSVWANLSQTSLVYVGGLFGNFLILSLCIYWLVGSNLRETPNLFIAIFLSVGILPILFGGEVIQSRALYNISFQIPAAIALVYLSSQRRGHLLVFSIAIWISVTSIQAVINFI